VVAAGFLARVDGVRGDQWTDPTPCERWTVRDVVAHAVNVHGRILARLNGGELPAIEPPPPQPGEDLPADLRALVAAVQEAVDDPARAAREVDSINGPMTFGGLVGTLLCEDTLLHTWDIARATGQDERLDPGAVRDVLGSLLPRDATLRHPEEFGPRLDASADADEQARLIAFSGRTN
jgi:uncharacterized protein (TIGR03086 family)